MRAESGLFNGYEGGGARRRGRRRKAKGEGAVINLSKGSKDTLAFDLIHK